MKVKSSFKALLPYLLPAAFIVGVGVVFFKVYHQFFGTTANDSARDAADKVGASDLTTRAATTATSLSSLQQQLAAQGLTVGNLHQSLANNLNTLMDSVWVDHDAVIALVQSMGIETFQLTAIAYGQRELATYRNDLAFTHIFNPAVWADMFSSSKLYGGLKFHLQAVLSSGEFSSLGAYVNTIP